MTQIKILLADDHPMMLKGLELVLGTRKDYFVVGSVNNGRKAIDFVDEWHTDVAILDISMPVLNGLRAAEYIKSKSPSTKVIILTGYNHKHLVLEMVRIGVDGCLLKGNSHDLLFDAIDRVTSGKSYFDNVAEFDYESPNELASRELEVLREYCNERSIAEIAESLEVTNNTVKSHLRNIRLKLGLSKSSELIRYAINQGIV